MKKDHPYCGSGILLLFSCMNKNRVPDVSDIKVDLPGSCVSTGSFLHWQQQPVTGSEPAWSEISSSYTHLSAKYIGSRQCFNPEWSKQFSAKAGTPIDSVVGVRFKIWDIKTAFEMPSVCQILFSAIQVSILNCYCNRSCRCIGTISNGYTPDFLGNDFLRISLQFYLGSDYPLYTNHSLQKKSLQNTAAAVSVKNILLATQWCWLLMICFPTRAMASHW